MVTLLLGSTILFALDDLGAKTLSHYPFVGRLWVGYLLQRSVRTAFRY
jgi:hypothetical protein